MGLRPGDRAPEFTLIDQHGQRFDIKLYLGVKPLVIFFYPKDYTPGCTIEVCSFRDHYEDFTELGAEVIGISSDSEQTHKNFAAKYKLPFRLLADTGKKVRRLFGVQNRLLNLLPGRETFVIGKDGKLIMSFNSVNAYKHMEKALNVLKEEVK